MADTRIDELRRRLERDPGSRLFAQLAEELRKNGELAEAIRVARAGLAVHPSYPSARLTLGRALLDSSDAAGARAELERALREAPDNILASRFLAQARESLGDLKGALEQYEKTLQMSPDDRQLQAQLSSVEAKLRARGAAGAAPGAATAGGARMAPPPVAAFGVAAPVGGGAASNLAPTIRIQAAAPVPAAAAPRPVPPPPPPAQAAAPPPAPPPPAPPPAAARVEHREKMHGVTAPSGPAEDLWFPAAEATTPDAGLPATLVDPTQSAPTITTQAFAPAPAAAPPPASTPQAAGAEGSASSAPFSSSTLAELYFQQGLVDRAVDVYRQLVQQEPANEKARLRLVELETANAGPEERAARRRALERTIAGLESLLAAVQRR